MKKSTRLAMGLAKIFNIMAPVGTEVYYRLFKRDSFTKGEVSSPAFLEGETARFRVKNVIANVPCDTEHVDFDKVIENFKNKG